MGKFIDLTGQRFGRLVVLQREGTLVSTGGSARITWRCRCDCGSDTVSSGQTLKAGKAKSCGCLQPEAARKAKTTHGHRSYGKLPAEYVAWHNMLDRCFNPNSRSYPDYGGRGITVCERWRESYPNFLADMGERPPGKYSLERQDVNGDYRPNNCIWLPHADQARNRRSNRYLTFEGETLSLADWARKTGIPYQALQHRLDDMGWSVGKALTTPARKMTKRMFKFQGRTLSLSDWARELGVSHAMLYHRVVTLGWPVEYAFTAPTGNHWEHGDQPWKTDRDGED